MISIAIVAVLLEIDTYGRVQAAAVAIGACPRSRSGRRWRARLGAAIADGRLSQIVRDEHLSPLRPMSDVRGTSAYRLDAASTLVRRALDEVQGRLQ